MLYKWDVKKKEISDVSEVTLQRVGIKEFDLERELYAYVTKQPQFSSTSGLSGFEC